MKQGIQRNLVEWLVCFVLALAVCIGVILYEKGFAQWGIARMACDGCFVSGILFVGLGVLVWVANFNGFTSLGYAWYLLVRKLSPSRARFEERLSYVEYVQSHQKKNKNPVCILVTGLVYIVLSFVFLWLSR